MHDNPAQPIIACNPNAIDSAERESHAALAQAIFSQATILEIHERADGYEFRLPLETAMLLKCAAWIANERLCCPFFTFTLVVGQHLSIQLSGTAEVKAVIQSDVLSMLATGAFPSLETLQDAYDAALTDAGL